MVLRSSVRLVESFHKLKERNLGGQNLVIGGDFTSLARRRTRHDPLRKINVEGCRRSGGLARQWSMD